MGTATELGYEPGNFYVWRASDGFAIHLSLKVVAQLSALAGETRGILLGRKIETPFRATVIDDCKLVAASEDSSENEQRALGFFRIERDGNLKLAQRDLETFSQLFCKNGDVGLVIRTSGRGESDAGLFYWQDGAAHPHDVGVGFPFDAGRLASGHLGWRYPDPIENPATPSVATKPGIRWARLLATAALVIVGMVGLQLASNSNSTVSAAPAIDSSLGLKVISRPQQLEIRWNRDSAAVAASDKGEMTITEAGMTEAVPFDESQLRDGYVAYTPMTNDVSIRLEVTDKDGGTTSESVRSVAIP